MTHGAVSTVLWLRTANETVPLLRNTRGKDRPNDYGIIRMVTRWKWSTCPAAYRICLNVNIPLPLSHPSNVTRLYFIIRRSERARILNRSPLSSNSPSLTAYNAPYDEITESSGFKNRLSSRPSGAWKGGGGYARVN